MSNANHRELPTIRYETAFVDTVATISRDSIASADAELRLRHPSVEEALYSEPSYNSEVYKYLGLKACVLADATRTLIEAENMRNDVLSEVNPIQVALLTKVPDMSWHRAEKPKYRTISIDSSHPLHGEEIVPLNSYGVLSRSYYSRPNNATGDPVPGVKPEVFVRKSVAEKLARINQRLSAPEVTHFFGGKIELFVEEGWRDPRLQQYLHDEVIPTLIRKELAHKEAELGAEAFEEMVRQEASRKIAWSPATAQDSPSPHATGGAVDLTLRYRDTHERIFFGRGPAQMVNRTDPDTFEHTPPTDMNEQLTAQNLYALHAIMRGIAFDELTGFEPNPTEFWHWSLGDQLNYIVSGETPYYGHAPMNGVTTYEPIS